MRTPPTTLPSLQSETRAHTGYRRAAAALLRSITAISVAGALLVLALTVVPLALGFHTLIVTSGSMTPAIRTGDAVLIRHVDADAINPGDIVTFPSGRAGKGTTTHRVVDTRLIGGQRYVQTKGDANEVADPDLTAAGAVVGKVRVTLPKVGYYLYFASLRWGKVLLIGLPLLLITAQEIWSLLGPRDIPEGID